VTSQPDPGLPLDPNAPPVQPGEPVEDEDLTFDDGTF
jgi:hypothetical protein